MARDAEHDKSIYANCFGGTVEYLGAGRGFSVGTKAEEEIIEHIRRFPALYPGTFSVLETIFLGNGTGIEWTKRGTITGLKSTEPRDCCREYAAQVYAHMTREFVCISFPVSWVNAFTVPDNATDDWLALAMRFFEYVLGLDEKEYRLQLVAYLHRGYGHKNPNIPSEIEGRMRDFKETRKRMTEAAKAYGWTFLLPQRETKKQKEAQAKLAHQIISEILQKEAAK